LSSVCTQTNPVPVLNFWIDSTTVDGIAGWEEYITIDRAIKSNIKQDYETAALERQKEAMKRRIEAAVRALRDLGLQVLEQHLCGDFPAQGEPTVRIVRDPSCSIAPLLDATGPRRWIRGPVASLGAVTTVYAPFRGVLVIWEERA
ncbi:MAG: hypothetical protein AzoDbin1_05138, partial [Azoarcus sp.]|nr:hypothetical protein [Azoarcus sp.]